MTLHWEDISVKEGKHSETPCDCCDTTTVSVEGDLEARGGWLAFYMVRWSRGHPDIFPIFTIGTGDWSDAATNRDRWYFGAEFDREQAGFRLLDMAAKGNDVNATCLDRVDIIDTSFATEAFAMFDAIFMNDGRLAEIRDDT